jgi:hypothetical protein
VVSAADPHGRQSQFSRPEPLLFLSSSSSFILTRDECTPFKTHCYAGNLVAPGIEPGTPGCAARLQRRSYSTFYAFTTELKHLNA